jgi:hypothetical protein
MADLVHDDEQIEQHEHFEQDKNDAREVKNHSEGQS